MQVSGILSAWLMYHFDWSSMNYIVAGMMVIDLLFLVCCTRHTRAVPKFPLYGIDWLGAALWSAFLLQATYFFCYGQFHDWLDSPVMKTLAVTAPDSCCRMHPRYGTCPRGKLQRRDNALFSPDGSIHPMVCIGWGSGRMHFRLVVDAQEKVQLSEAAHCRDGHTRLSHDNILFPDIT